MGSSPVVDLNRKQSTWTGDQPKDPSSQIVQLIGAHLVRPLKPSVYFCKVLKLKLLIGPATSDAAASSFTYFRCFLVGWGQPNFLLVGLRTPRRICTSYRTNLGKRRFYYNRGVVPIVHDTSRFKPNTNTPTFVRYECRSQYLFGCRIFRRCHTDRSEQREKVTAPVFIEVLQLAQAMKM